jgi:acylphosphatase
MTAQPPARLHLVVSGRVQGVWFRQSTADAVAGLGLTGWIRNLPDGRVEALAEGARPALEALLAACRRGPPAARVEGVEVAWGEAAGDLPPFEVRRS